MANDKIDGEKQGTAGRGKMLVTAVIYVSLLTGVVLNCSLQDDALQTWLSNCILAILLAGVFHFYLKTYSVTLLFADVRTIVFWGSFFLSFLLLGAGETAPLGIGWMHNRCICPVVVPDPGMSDDPSFCKCKIQARHAISCACASGM